MNNQDIKIIFCDVDYTIYHDELNSFNMPSIKALKQAQRNGVKVVICTARPYDALNAIGLFKIFKPDAVIAECGISAVVDNKVIFEQTFDAETVKKVLEISNKYNVCCEFSESINRFFSKPSNDLVRGLFDFIHDEINIVKSIYDNEKVVAMNLFSDPSMDEIISKELPNGLIMGRFCPTCSDLFYQKASKGIGVKKVLEHFNLQKENALGIGDDLQDIEMFNECGASIAMGNAKEEVKNSATFICESILDKGLVTGLIHFNVIEAKKPIKTNLGVLLPVSALPGNYAIGDFGDCAYKFIKWLSKNHYRYWQVLPLNPIGSGNSPYMSSCSNAIDLRYISLEDLSDLGLLKSIPLSIKRSNKVDYKVSYEIKLKYLYKAYREYLKTDMNGLKRFKTLEPWVNGYATYMVFKDLNNGASWMNWSKEEIDYFATHSKLPRKYIKKCDFYCFVQFIAYSQWKKIVSFAHRHNIKIIGDIPFYVSLDSVDCYLNKDKFMLDEKYNPTLVAGVPPDAFSDEGQLWGSPIYNFSKMKEDNYTFLVERIGHMSNIVDIVRLDHFRAFDTYCVIPSLDKDAKRGEWRNGPGYDFFNALYQKYPNINILAEDLGELFPSVHALRNHYQLPGMFVYQFECFDNTMRDTSNCVIYSGTHDNQTLQGFIDNLSTYDKQRLNEKFNYPDNLQLEILNYLSNLPSKMIIYPITDLLGLGNEYRINTPSTVNENNWAFKLKSLSCLKTIKFKNK